MIQKSVKQNHPKSVLFWKHTAQDDSKFCLQKWEQLCNYINDVTHQLC